MQLAHNNIPIIFNAGLLGSTATTCQLSVAVGIPESTNFDTFNIVQCQETQGKVLIEINNNNGNNGSMWHRQWQT